MSTSACEGLNQERLDAVVNALKAALRRPELRCLSQRAIQAKIWHLEPIVASYLSDLRCREEAIRREIFVNISSLIFQFHEHTLDATLARAGILSDIRFNGGSSLEAPKAMDLFCLDSKERLYLLLKHYDWLKQFFNLYPSHFYENSFQFVDRIPAKKLPVKVKVIGLGIGGSLAVSGLARARIESVVGYEKRSRKGLQCVSSRYQNASWRAYDIARTMLDDTAYETLVRYQQKVHVTQPDGTAAVLTTDRVQIILGEAIDAALGSAARYGAQLNFESKIQDYYSPEDNLNNLASQEHTDIVAIFAGAHCCDIFPELRNEMNIISWPELTSKCRTWLRIKDSDKKEPYTARGGEIGAEHWHFTIESSRDNIDDILRVRDHLLVALEKSKSDAALSAKLESQLEHVDKVIDYMKSKENGARFDYIFTNAPENDHNMAKRDMANQDGTVVLDGGYDVEIKIACCSAIDANCSVSPSILKPFNTDVIVTGGDACVPPNPLAAYGATLACESAGMLLQLAVAYGHLNAILLNMRSISEIDDVRWAEKIRGLKQLFLKYYDARSQSENYFQFVQTVLCNLYSLHPIEA